MSESSGVVGIVEGDYTGQPADTQVWIIGGQAYEADSGGGITGGNIAVTIGGDADTTYASLVTAIDGGPGNVDADVPVLGRLRIRTAVSAGGAVQNSGGSVAVSETAANFDWRGANTNQNGRGTASRRRETCRRTIDTLFVAAASARLCEFSWTPSRVVNVQVRAADGMLINIGSDLWTISGNAVLWTASGVAHIADTQIVDVTVEE